MGAPRQQSSSPTRPATGAQARADETRRRLIDETVRCVIEEGFSAASARHIAERAGVTWGVIQYHFGDRDGLLAAVIDDTFADLVAGLATVEVDAGSTRDRALALVDAAWRVFSSPQARAGLEILVATRTAGGGEVSAHLVAMGRELTRLSDRVLAGSDSSDVQAVGDVVWATLRGFVLAQMLVAGPLDFAVERAALVDLVVLHLEQQGD